MKVIYKVDKVFLLIYSVIIVCIGLVPAVYLKNFSYLLIPLGVEALYLYLSLKKPFKRYRNLKAEFPTSSKEFIFDHAEELISSGRSTLCLAGWLEMDMEGDYLADLSLLI